MLYRRNTLFRCGKSPSGRLFISLMQLLPKSYTNNLNLLFRVGTATFLWLVIARYLIGFVLSRGISILAIVSTEARLLFDKDKSVRFGKQMCEISSTNATLELFIFDKQNNILSYFNQLRKLRILVLQKYVFTIQPCRSSESVGYQRKEQRSPKSLRDFESLKEMEISLQQKEQMRIPDNIFKVLIRKSINLGWREFEIVLQLFCVSSEEASDNEKLFSRVLAKQYLKDIKKNTLQYVEGQGFFRNSIEASIIEKVIPQFYSSSFKEQMSLDLWYKQVQQLLKEVKKQICQQNNKAKENQRERRKKILEKRQQLAREKNERKLMREEEKYMKNFLIEEKLKLEREEQQRRLLEEAAQNADQEAS